jgi:hypothetical protein
VLILLRLEEPAAGLGVVFAHPMGGQIFLMIRFYFFGDRAAGVIARDETLWRAWLRTHFPAGGPLTPADCGTAEVAPK